MKRENCIRFCLSLLLVLGFATSLSARHVDWYSVDYPGAIATECNDVTDSYLAVGDYTDTSNVIHGFIVSSVSFPAQSFSALDYPGARMTYAWGVNIFKKVVGYYLDSANNSHGFLYDITTTTFQSIDYPGATATVAYGIDFEGEIVGTWFDTSLNPHGFILVGGTYTSFDYPGSTGTNAIGAVNISTGGPPPVIVGYFFDSSNAQHGFVRESDETFIQVDHPHSSLTSVDRESENHNLVGVYGDKHGVLHGFAAYDTGTKVRRFTTFDYPGAAETRIRGIYKPQAFGYIIGRWTDSKGIVHGFLGDDFEL